MSIEDANNIPVPNRQELKAFGERMDGMARPGTTNTRENVFSQVRQARSERNELLHQERELVMQASAHRSEVDDHGREKLDLEQKVAGMRQLIQDHETSLVKRTMNYFRPQLLAGIRSQLGEAEAQLEAVNVQYDKASQQYAQQGYESAISTIRANRLALEQDAQGYIKTYYDKLTRQWNLYREAQIEKAQFDEYRRTEGQVESRILDKGYFLVHAIKPQFGESSYNSAINFKSDWKDRIAYMLQHGPTLCASSFRSSEANTEAVELWANIGIVLNRGTIEDAYPYDAHSLVSEDGRRSTRVYNIRQYEQKIDEALAASTDNFNEIIVSDPQPAAMFVNTDQLDSRVNIDSMSEDDIIWQTGETGSATYRSITAGDLMNAAQFFNLPVLAFDTGQAKILQFDEQTDRFSRGRDITPQELATWKFVSPDAGRFTEMADRVANRPEALV